MKIYSNDVEVIVVEDAHERAMLAEYFAPGTDRFLEDYDVEVADMTVVSSRLRTENNNFVRRHHCSACGAER